MKDNESRDERGHKMKRTSEDGNENENLPNRIPDPAPNWFVSVFAELRFMNCEDFAEFFRLIMKFESISDRTAKKASETALKFAFFIHKPFWAKVSRVSTVIRIEFETRIKT